MNETTNDRPTGVGAPTALMLGAAMLLACGSQVSPGDAGDSQGGDATSDSRTTDDVVGDRAIVGRVPMRHRAAAENCPRPPPPLPDGGVGADSGFVPDASNDQCAVDRDCTARGGGHCVSSRVGRICTYDTCYADGDCTMGACVCAGGVLGNAGANVCLMGNCRVDADCGANGYCSPTYDTMCGPYSGFRGFYCHTPRDACIDDADCVMGTMMGYCAFQPTVGSWACSYSFCAG